MELSLEQFVSKRKIWTSTWNDILGGCVWPKETEMGKMLQKWVQGDGKDSREGKRGGCSARVAWREQLRSGLGKA